MILTYVEFFVGGFYLLGCLVALIMCFVEERCLEKQGKDCSEFPAVVPIAIILSWIYVMARSRFLAELLEDDYDNQSERI